MKPRLHSVLNLALLLASVGVGTYWALQLAARRPPDGPTVPTPPSSVPRSTPTDTAPAARLFGSPAAAPSAGPAQIVLLGVIAEGGRGSGVALLGVNGANPQTFRVGDAIGTSQMVLAEVRADRVVLRTGDRTEDVRLPEKPPVAGIERSR